MESDNESSFAENGSQRQAGRLNAGGGMWFPILNDLYGECELNSEEHFISVNPQKNGPWPTLQRDSSSAREYHPHYRQPFHTRATSTQKFSVIPSAER